VWVALKRPPGKVLLMLLLMLQIFMSPHIFAVAFRRFEHFA
jgi:hypothetical protein